MVPNGYHASARLPDVKVNVVMSYLFWIFCYANRVASDHAHVICVYSSANRPTCIVPKNWICWLRLNHSTLEITWNVQCWVFLDGEKCDVRLKPGVSKAIVCLWFLIVSKYHGHFDTIFSFSVSKLPNFDRNFSLFRVIRWFILAENKCKLFVPQIINFTCWRYIQT